MTRYGFRQALGGFFAVDTAALRRHLPGGLSPIEVHPGQSVLAVTIFEFVESEVGGYGELVISAVVPPFATRDEALPDAAFFPLALATTTPASRRHAAERWHLPEHPTCLDIRFEVGANAAEAFVEDEGRPVLRLRVGRTRATASHRSYQCFSRDRGAIYRVPIDIVGPLDEHEEDRGILELVDHPVTASIAAALDDPHPFREQYMGAGEQRFGELVPHIGAGR